MPPPGGRGEPVPCRVTERLDLDDTPNPQAVDVSRAATLLFSCFFFQIGPERVDIVFTNLASSNGDEVPLREQ